jgi:hypothetical protein
MSRRAPEPGSGVDSVRAAAEWSFAGWLWLAVLFLGAALLVYRPAFDGPFLSDDMHYVANNPYVHELSAENVLVILDPSGPATLAIVNYAPAQLLLHAVAWSAFGSETRGHHILNVVLHSVASALLAALLASCGVPVVAAAVGGGLFLLQPANVEAVAWVSQLKSTLALVLSLAALLAWRRWPALGSVLFAFALLAKATAAFALPVALLLDWTRTGRVRWRWVGLWSLVFAAYAITELSAHQRSGAAEAALYETPLVLLRTVVAIAGRYLVMGTTSIGVSAFHEPDPATSWLDPWWLGSLVALALLGWRAWVVLRRRETELAWWVWALIAFVPVSQVFPFLYPVADRYLYFILPGLLGGALLAGRESLLRFFPEPDRRRGAGRALLALALVLAALFAIRSHERARLWRSSALLVAEAAANYPEGKAGLIQAAKRAALVGDAPAAVAALRRASERGYNRFEQVATDPGWDPVRRDPGFQQLLRDMAGSWIERARSKGDLTQNEVWTLAHAHIARAEIDAAAAELRRAVEMGGPYTERIRAELASVEAALEVGRPERIRLGVPGG